MTEIRGSANWCRDHQMELRKGSGPHAYQLWCTECNKHVQWVSTRDAFYITRREINTVDNER